MRFAVQAGPVRLAVRLLPWCLLRTSGMPAHLLDGLARPELLHTVDRLLVVEAALAGQRQDFLEHRWEEIQRAAQDLLPPGRRFRGHLYRAHKHISASARLDEQASLGLEQVGHGAWAEQWNRCFDEVQSLCAGVREGFASVLRRSAEAALRALGTESVRHAIFVSNPGFCRDTLPALLDRGYDVDSILSSPRRRQLMTAHRYLRRLAARCETTSFFGPVTFARLDQRQPAALTVAATHAPAAFIGPSTWLVEAIDRHLASRLPPERLVVRRSPLYADDAATGGSTLERRLDGRRFRLSDTSARLYRAIGDDATVADLAGALGWETEQIRAGMQRLGPAVLTGAAALPATEHHPLERLAEVNAGGVVRELADLLARFANTPWPDRQAVHAELQDFVASLDIDLRRHPGRHYADRELFHEDRSSRYSEVTTFGQPVVHAIGEALRGVLGLHYLAALLAREDARECVRKAMSEGDDALLRLAGGELTDPQPRVRALQRRLVELAASRAPDGAGDIALTRTEVDRAVAEFWARVPAGDQAEVCLPSPDLMAVGDALGSGQWLLSELHDDCSSIYGGVEAQLFTDPAGLFARFAAAVTAVVDPARMATVVSRRRSAHVTPELPGIGIELSGRSAKPRHQVHPVAAARVSADARRVVVDGHELQLYPGDLASPLHRAVSLPALKPIDIDLGAHTPRIVVDNVIVQRARWRLRLPEPPAQWYQRWLQIMRLRHASSLPQRVFLRHPGQPKPLYVDFADPLAVLDLARLGPAEVVLTEMLPTPEQFWWRVDGATQCAELRIGCVVAPVDAPAPAGASAAGGAP